MSGGSFNYLCFAEIPERAEHLRKIHDTLREAGLMSAALATEQFLAKPSPELQELWRSVEWWKSGDYGFDQVLEAFYAWAKT